jgi:hypothetical protein
MKYVLYFLAAVAGLFGLLSLLRAFELLLTGGAFQAVEFVIGAVGLFLSWLWIKRARSL